MWQIKARMTSAPPSIVDIVDNNVALPPSYSPSTPLDNLPPTFTHEWDKITQDELDVAFTMPPLPATEIPMPHYLQPFHHHNILYRHLDYRPEHISPLRQLLAAADQFVLQLALTIPPIHQCNRILLHILLLATLSVSTTKSRVLRVFYDVRMKHLI